ncbi:hypothetical protein [Halegenticoccus tardaugens]|uniref:hypothetical protein n=1 Tax=Halegenticoccus tardaugens TaxID=2071624 RepID=UPI00100AC886|nr:hypothetical protein [Halegenticoccus tardaugens]
MSDEREKRGFGRATRIALTALLAFVLVGSAVQLRAEGIAALPEFVVSVYVTAVVAYGVYADAMGTSRFRVALYAGVVAWGAVALASGTENALTYVLLAVGALLLTRELTFGR